MFRLPDKPALFDTKLIDISPIPPLPSIPTTTHQTTTTTRPPGVSLDIHYEIESGRRVPGSMSPLMHHDSAQL